MSYFNDSSFNTCYQFPRWSKTMPRPNRTSSAKRVDETSKFNSNSRNQFESSSKTRFIEQNTDVSRELRAFSPPPLYQPAPTPDRCSIDDQLSLISSDISSSHLTTLRIKSAELKIPLKTNSEDLISNSFAKQSHEKRKVAQERKRRKQQAQKYTGINSDAWTQLRQTPVPLKRLTTIEGDLLEPSISSFNRENYSFETLKQAIHEEQKEKNLNSFKLESGTCTPMDFRPSSKTRPRTSIPSSQNYSSNFRMAKRSTETSARPIFEPFMVASKPLHPLLLTSTTHLLKTKFKMIKPPSSAITKVRSSRSTSAPPTKLIQAFISNPPINPPNVKEEEDDDEVKARSSSSVIVESPNYSRPSSNLSVRSTIKLQSQIPRCRSANDTKSSFLLNKTYPRFILITDDEHRIESWYHRYPFIIGNDLLQLFQSKPKKSTISAYFINDSQEIFKLNQITNHYLQDKPFHIDNDWINYDLILITNKIYQDIIIYLQVIINLIIKSSGKIIHIYQINHQEDLKTQVTYICKQISHS